MKKQKNLIVALILMVLQFGFFWIPYLPLSQSVAIYIFYILSLLSVIFSIVSLIKKEAATAVGVILFEILVAITVMMGGGLSK